MRMHVQIKGCQQSDEKNALLFSSYYNFQNKRDTIRKKKNKKHGINWCPLQNSRGEQFKNILSELLALKMFKTIYFGIKGNASPSLTRFLFVPII